MTKENETKQEVKDPVNYTDEDLAQLEADVKKATGEEQQAAVTKALDEAKTKMAEKKAMEELQTRQEEMKKELEEEKKKYADSLEKLKKEAEDNAKKLVDELRDERQSTTNTDNPFNKDDSNDKEQILAKLRNDPEAMKEFQDASEKAFREYHRI